MDKAGNKILERMLERLFAGLVSGPNLNCRPYSSRQRLDCTHWARLRDVTPEEALGRLLGDDRKVKLTAQAPAPRRPRKASDKKAAGRPAEAGPPEDGSADPAEAPLTPEEQAIQDAWTEQQGLLSKLRVLVEEARTYQQDTGVHVLNVGLPLLSLPPGAHGLGGARTAGKRILAPIAFVPVEITLRSGPTASLEIACLRDEIDTVTPNMALLAWLEQLTGVTMPERPAEAAQGQPWAEISVLVRQVAGMLKLPVPEVFQETPAVSPPDGGAAATDATTAVAEPKDGAPALGVPLALKLKPAPRADDQETGAAVRPAAVLGLFPMHNQGLLQDTQAMLTADALDGPVESFLHADVHLDEPPDVGYEHAAWAGHKKPRVFAEERLVTYADPCQARAVRLARECRGLVVHGPPGTGKSQTITNIIGDHLARGERVLMVCDKRTALDVVAHRLDHLGLAGLCAVIHDPRHDQRDLYRKLREQLENLTDARSDPWAERKLARIDAELQSLHTELSEYWSLLMTKDAAHGVSFHELVGQWLDMPSPEGAEAAARAPVGANLDELEGHRRDVQEILERSAKIDYPHHPWRKAAGIALGPFLGRPMSELRSALNAGSVAAGAADATRDPAMVPFTAAVPLAAQAQARRELADQLGLVIASLEARTISRWIRQDLETARRARQKLVLAAPYLSLVRGTALDAELELLVLAEKPNLAKLGRHLAALEAYLEHAGKWYGLLFWQRRTRAAQILGPFGLTTSPAAARRLLAFYQGVRARLLLQALHKEFIGADSKKGSMTDDDLLASLSALDALLALRESLHTAPSLAGLEKPVAKILAAPGQAASFLTSLRQAPARAAALDRLQTVLSETGLFDAGWLAQQQELWRAGAAADGVLVPLAQSLDTLEDVLRLRDSLAPLPAWLGQYVEAMLPHLRAAEPGLAVIHKAVLHAAITERLQANPRYQALDLQRLQAHFRRMRELEQQKQAAVQGAVQHHWLTRQKERLLAATGSRLNSQGADLRRRLTMRGDHAMRLRQVVAVGRAIEGGDPLFDLCPVWLASPETVAQVFPRTPLFDVVVFDEASQCRLEEALPVLTRARRVVIAGDPKQLPPTRFFESALAVSAEEEIESEQQLFEAHQGEIEDLLGAALSLDIQQCYLDVHYRSRNADLIEFSNQQFYGTRLQAIPGHPSHRARFAPITLYRADGVYDQRCNPVEAEQVCRIVRDLLRRAEPPSIGIACFNLAQRDLIVEKLDELAVADREFAGRLSEARSRRGDASFEGLFVKNLENVQGDEREHIILSTTYGPDPQGRFYRRFGPLGRAGGGRRLNVLVTRARQEIHVVTSIPASVYRALPPVPPGQTPGGAWLLFSYLAFAEHLAEVYQAVHEVEEAREASASAPPDVQVLPSQTPSLVAQALAKQLATAHQVGSIVHWGNEGFCVDVALRHPRRANDVTVGVLCDGTRFTQAEDPMEWDLFRTTVLESQGWKLHRLWTPHLFRDVEGGIQRLLGEVAEMLATEEDGPPQRRALE